MTPRILVYCGINECVAFEKLARHFDISYGFEADPRLAALAKERYAGSSNIHIVHAAVCERSGLIEFNLHNHGAASSLGRLGDDYRRSTGNDIRSMESVQVPAVNLCEYLASQKVDLIDLYQSDIQGMDFTVLNTLRPLIEKRRIRKIRCETERDGHAYQSYEGLPSNRQSLFRDLLGNDYRVSRRHKAKANWASQDITWKLKSRHLLRWHMSRWG